jgi:hypothetical protein
MIDTACKSKCTVILHKPGEQSFFFFSVLEQKQGFVEQGTGSREILVMGLFSFAQTKFF